MNTSPVTVESTPPCPGKALEQDGAEISASSVAKISGDPGLVSSITCDVDGGALKGSVDDAARFTMFGLLRFFGTGFMAAVAFLDPGNLEAVGKLTTRPVFVRHVHTKFAKRPKRLTSHSIDSHPVPYGRKSGDMERASLCICPAAPPAFPPRRTSMWA